MTPNIQEYLSLRKTVGKSFALRLDLILEGSTTLLRKYCSSKAVLCPYSNHISDGIWSESIFTDQSFYGINLRIMLTDKKVVVVLFDEVSRTVLEGYFI